MNGACAGGYSRHSTARKAGEGGPGPRSTCSAERSGSRYVGATSQQQFDIVPSWEGDGRSVCVKVSTVNYMRHRHRLTTQKVSLARIDQAAEQLSMNRYRSRGRPRADATPGQMTRSGDVPQSALSVERFGSQCVGATSRQPVSQRGKHCQPHAAPLLKLH